MTIDNNQIIINIADDPRIGWEEAFKSTTQNGDDAVLDNFDAIQHAWDETEWQW